MCTTLVTLGEGVRVGGYRLGRRSFAECRVTAEQRNDVDLERIDCVMKDIWY